MTIFRRDSGGLVFGETTTGSLLLYVELEEAGARFSRGMAMWLWSRCNDGAPMDLDLLGAGRLAADRRSPEQ